MKWLRRLTRRHPVGLSTRLLGLTLVFVMVSEVLIYVPSIASFQQSSLAERLHTAGVAAMALVMTDEAGVPDALKPALLAELDAFALAVKQEEMRRLLAMVEMPTPVARDLDLDMMTPMVAIREAFDTLLFGGERTIRLTGPFSEGGGGRLELVFSEAGLRGELLVYSRNILILSLAISAFTALLVYYSLRRMFVRPMQRIGQALERFSEAPEDPARIIQPSGGAGEIAETEERILAMQRQLQDTLKQQRRLADLGLAVAKINHDLRNLLASAQLVSDRLTHIADPTVQRFAPKLIAALDRAIGYCQSVLAYGKAQEPAPQRRLVALRRLVEEVAAVAGVEGRPEIEWVCDVPEGLEADADPDQLFRALVNLVRNAVEALEGSDGRVLVRRLTLSARRSGAVIAMRIADTGPGLPPLARENLFRPFQGAAKRGGTGLGLAIAAEIVRAHGGSLTLVDDGPGTTFDIELPDRPIPIGGHPPHRHREAG
jgi:signal transduction histidine kinase